MYLAKRELRQNLRHKLATLDEKQRTRINEAILHQLLQLPQWQDAQRVFCYISRMTEVDTHRLIRHHCNFLSLLAVPRIVTTDCMYAVRFPGWQQLKSDKMGILSPTSTDPCSGPWDVVITPGLGFDSSGARLGYGRGYYDRWFDENRTICKIALCYPCQLVESVPQGHHDVSMDIILTGQRIIRI